MVTPEQRAKKNLANTLFSGASKQPKGPPPKTAVGPAKKDSTPKN